QVLLGGPLQSDHGAGSPLPFSVCSAAALASLAARSDADPGRLRPTQSSMWRCGPDETASAPGGTSRRTTVPAPVAAPSPSSTGATNVLLEAVRACRPLVVRCFRTPS